MSEELTQFTIDHEARNHVNRLAALLEAIGAGSGSQVCAGYVEHVETTDHTAPDEVFTEMGLSMCTLTRLVAKDSAQYLWDVLGETTGSVDTRLLNEVQGLCCIVASALERFDAQAPAGVNGPWLAFQLLGQAQTIQAAVEAKFRASGNVPGAAVAPGPQAEPESDSQADWARESAARIMKALPTIQEELYHDIVFLAGGVNRGDLVVSERAEGAPDA